MIGVLLVCIMLGADSSVSADNKGQISDLENEISANEKKYQEIQDKLDSLQESKDDLELYMKELSETCEAIESVIDDLDKQIAEKNAKIEETDSTLALLKDDIETQYEQMKLRIQYIYESGNMDMGNVLLSMESIADALEQAEYISTIMEYDREQLAKYKNSLASAARLSDRLQKEQATLLTLKDEQNIQKANINKMMSEAQTNIASHKEQIEAAIAMADKIEKDIEDAENTVEKLKEEEERRKQEEANKNNNSSNSGNSAGNTSNKIPYQQLDGDIKRMAAIIWCEARGESYEGQVAVGTVVMNRVESSRFPNTIEGVISQKGQFSPYKSGKYALALSLENMQQSCIDAAIDVIVNGVRSGDWLFFRMKNGIIKGDIIGCHVFY